jgi:hypothetical protein
VFHAAAGLTSSGITGITVPLAFFPVGGIAMAAITSNVNVQLSPFSRSKAPRVPLALSALSQNP